MVLLGRDRIHPEYLEYTSTASKYFSLCCYQTDSDPLPAADWLRPGSPGCGRRNRIVLLDHNVSGTRQCHRRHQGMFSITVGKPRVTMRPGLRGWVLQSLVVLVPMVILFALILQYYFNPFKTDWNLALLESFNRNSELGGNIPDGPCTVVRQCPDDHYSFFVQSGAANVFGPKICIENELVLGTVLNNAGTGLNIVVVNDRTGTVTKTGNFNTYSGHIELLIEFLKKLDKGSVLLVASYDEPSSKLNEEARNLFAELGSSSIQSLGFRDNWVFVVEKGDSMMNKYEKYMKNDASTNKYNQWPELVSLDGCLPKRLD